MYKIGDDWHSLEYIITYIYYDIINTSAKAPSMNILIKIYKNQLMGIISMQNEDYQYPYLERLDDIISSIPRANQYLSLGKLAFKSGHDSAKSLFFDKNLNNKK